MEFWQGESFGAQLRLTSAKIEQNIGAVFHWEKNRH
jgi:hypothetical protein